SAYVFITVGRLEEALEILRQLSENEGILNDRQFRIMIPLLWKTVRTFVAGRPTQELVNVLVKESEDLNDFNLLEFFIRLCELNIRFYFSVDLVKVLENCRFEQRELQQFYYFVHYK